MFDSPHTSAPMLMRGNALVLKKTPVEKAPRTSIETQLSWSSDPFSSTLSTPLITSSRISTHRQPATVSAEELGRRGTMLSLTTTGAAPELQPAKVSVGDAVFRTSTRGTVTMGQYAGCQVELMLLAPSSLGSHAACTDELTVMITGFYS